MLKINLEKEYKLKLGALAVEKIEDEYNKTIDEVLREDKLTSKKVSFILFCTTENYEKDLQEFKIELNKNYDYEEIMILFGALMGGKTSVEEMEKSVELEKEKITGKK